MMKLELLGTLTASFVFKIAVLVFTALPCFHSDPAITRMLWCANAFRTQAVFGGVWKKPQRLWTRKQGKGRVHRGVVVSHGLFLCNGPHQVTKKMTVKEWYKSTHRCRFTLSAIYDEEGSGVGDGGDDSASDGNTSDIAWTSLATTEKWIQDTLSPEGGKGGKTKKQTSNNNPYTRKEVSYQCETSTSPPRIVSGIFRRLREMREAGDAHGLSERSRLRRSSERRYKPLSHRQTLVVVIPSCTSLSGSFHTFDTLVQRINQARRNARDYVTDVAETKLEDNEGADWVTSVNLAHLHPNFGVGIDTAASSDENSEEDPKLKAYREKKLEARRSPFPSLVIEVKSVPPPPRDDGSGSSGRATLSPSPPEEGGGIGNGPSVTSADVQRLESLFGKSAASGSSEDNGSSVAYEEEYDEEDATDWIEEKDPLFNPVHCHITTSEARQVDEAYEFLFSAIDSSLKMKTDEKMSRQYLIMPHFLSRSATSFTMFARQAQNIVGCIPDLNFDGGSGKGSNEDGCLQLKVSTFHPETVEKDMRSPVPIIGLDWEPTSPDELDGIFN